MDLRINNNQPNFGMALLLDADAKAGSIVKKQALKLSKKGYEKFWNTIGEIQERQADNANNMILRAKGKNRLAVEVVDENADMAVKNYVIAQGLLSRNGSLKFLKKGERIGKKAAKTLKRNGKRISQFFDNDLRNSYSLITANYEKVKNSIFKKKTKNTKRKVLQARPKTKIIRKRTKTKQITKHRTIHKKVQSLKKSAKNMIKKLKFW